MTQTVGLLMMCRDEAPHLPRAVASVESMIDSFTVVDVGSSDDTVQVAKRLGARVHRRKWVDFIHNGNQLMKLGKGSADYLLIMSANDVIEQLAPLPELAAPQYMPIHRRNGISFRMPVLLKGDVDWHYHGPPVHSYLAPPMIDERQHLDSFVVNQLDDDGRREEKTLRYKVMLEDWVAKHPQDPRGVFYLAGTYWSLDRFDDAAAMYERRIALGGWDEEVFVAQYAKGKCELAAGRWYDGRITLLNAYWRRPTRAEPLRAICQSLIAPSGDVLFVEEDCYGQPLIPRGEA